MCCRPEFERLCRLINDSLHPFTEPQPLPRLTEEKEKDLLIILSQVSREIRRWKEENDSNSGREIVADPEFKCKLFQGMDPHLADHHDCLANIVAILYSKNRQIEQNGWSRSQCDASDQTVSEQKKFLPPEERVILVGHSFGGLGISLAMERFPAKISIAVFVTAFMPGPTLPFLSIDQKVGSNLGVLESGKPDSSLYQGHHSQPTYFIFSEEQLASQLYQLCPPEDFNLATTLVRPIAMFSDADTLKEIVVSREKYGSVRRVFIKNKEDKVITMDIQRWMIENNPPDEVKEITGSDHMVMLFKPHKLFTCLLGIAENYN